MMLRFIRPEDRRHGVGSGFGPGSNAGWADTEPACFRSEAFAEDLPDQPAGFPAVPRRRSSQALLLASGLFAALALRLNAGD